MLFINLIKLFDYMVLINFDKTAKNMVEAKVTKSCPVWYRVRLHML